MLQEWRKVLEDTGAEFDGDRLVSYGNPERERRIVPQGDVVCDLSGIGLIKVAGEDATDFLQSQLTNDISLVTESQAQLSAWCNPKGRTIATFLIHKRGDAYYLSLSADLMENVLKKLRMYVLRSKVELEDVTGSVVHFGTAGSHIDQDWDDCCDGDLPTDDYGANVIGNLSIIKIPGEVSRYELFGDLEDSSRLWQKLNVRAAPVSAVSWSYLNIASGLPMVTLQSSEVWIPQMLNLQIINGVSFKKGCFPGQEVVARLKYLGKNKRRVYRVGFATDQVPAVGELVVVEGGETEAGKILNAELNPDGKLEALAVLRIGMADQDLFLGSVDGPAGTLLELPFAADED